MIFKLLVVDDEVTMRKGISNYMNWDGRCHCQKEAIPDASGIFDLKSIDHYTGHDDVDTDD